MDVDDRIRAEFERVRDGLGDGNGELRGLYIDEGEVAHAVSALRERPSQVDEARLRDLATAFGLSPFEQDVLMACVLAELDASYGRIYAFLQDDVGRRTPSVGLLLRLFAPDGDERAGRESFHPEAPLLGHGLLRLHEGPDGSLSMTPVVAEERIVAHLLGADRLDRRLLAYTTLEPEPRPRLLTQRTFDLVLKAIQARPRFVALTGPDRVGKTQAARLFAHLIDSGLLLVDVAALLACESCSVAEAVRSIFREAALTSAVVYWSGAAGLWADNERASAARRAVESELGQLPAPCVFGARTGWEAPATLAGSPLHTIQIPLPNREERLDAWQGALRARGLDTDGLASALDHVASSFRLTVPQIADAVLVAVSLPRSDDSAGVWREQLCAGARAVSGRGLATLSREVIPKASWSHLVLPADSLAQLHELCSTVRTRSRVLEEWGFARRLTGGTGITALFAGVSGTGKTMAAEVIAHELGLPLFQIDLAGVVSKWIGETEKNLDRVFEAAADSNAVLFFDEADALFGKRSEVKDSHDRYANLEISYLLQKMESYDGVAIMATNMRQQIDDAFLRRLSFTIIFPMPEMEDRRRIWDAVWPPELPRGSDVDLARLARIKLTGGNIKNVVVAGAHNAAAANRSVSMADLIHAVRREYQKLGKQMSATEVEAALGG